MTVTNNYNLTLPTVGGDNNAWGTLLNNGVISALDAALGSSLAVTINSADVNLTVSQFQNMAFLLTGTLTGDRNLIVPLSPNSATVACGGRFIVVNGTTGSYNVTVKTIAVGSTGVVVPRGTAVALYSDGTNVGYDNSGLPAVILAVNGNPNGQLAGTAGSVNTRASIAYDYTNSALYVCTTTGTSSTAVWTAVSLNPTLVPVPFPPFYSQPSDNLVLANDSGNPNKSATVSAGGARDDSNVANLYLAATVYKRLDTQWAAGGSASPGNGGSDSVSVIGASQTWHAFLIGKRAMTITDYARSSNVATLTITGNGLGVGSTIRVAGVGSGFDGVFAITAATSNTVSYANTGSNSGALSAPSGATADGFDVLFSQSYSAPSLPSGWTVKQGIGSVISNSSSNIIQFFQYGDEFWFQTPILDVSSIPLNGANVLSTLTVPNGVKVQAIINLQASVFGGNTIANAYVSPPEVATTILLETIRANSASACNGQARCWTNTSKQIRVASPTANNVSVLTLGWRDPRRRTF